MGHIEKRGTRRYRARYIGPEGRERSKTFSRKIDAERWNGRAELPAEAQTAAKRGVQVIYDGVLGRSREIRIVGMNNHGTATACLIVEHSVAVAAEHRFGISALDMAIQELSRELDVTGQIDMSDDVAGIALDARKQRAQIGILETVPPLENGMLSCVAPFGGFVPMLKAVKPDPSAKN